MSIYRQTQFVAYFDAGVGNQLDPAALADQMFGNRAERDPVLAKGKHP